MAEEMTIFEDITNRTGGNIYISAVGPVRTGEINFYQKIYGFDRFTAYQRRI